MENFQKFKIGEISEKLSESGVNVLSELVNVNRELSDGLQKKLNENKKNQIVRVAFIGQYSSGKSTILSALTGDMTIKIHADIATDKTTDYKWNDVILIDTPGLYSDRPTHDRITNEQIKESDLLIYCLTSDLFDNVILENFKKLAFEDGYLNKMMLVINKMSMEAGSYIELKKNYTISLKKSIEPFDFHEFETAFIDAADYLEGKSIGDKELIKVSHFEDFISTLNGFVDKKGLLGRLDTPARIILSYIDNAISELEKSDESELFQTLERIEYETMRSKERSDSSVRAQVRKLAISVIRMSNELTSKVGMDGFNIDNEVVKMNNLISTQIEETKNDIQQICESELIMLEGKVSQILGTDLGKYVIKSIQTGKIELSDIEKQDLGCIIERYKILKSGSDSITDFVQGLTNTTGERGLSTAVTVAGSDSVTIIKNIGHFFGVKFKPWGAVNVAKNLSNAIKFLGPAISAIGLFISIYEAMKDEEVAKEIIVAKNHCHNQFLSIAAEIEMEFIKQMNEFMKETYDRVLNDIGAFRKSLIGRRQHNSEVSQKLSRERLNLEALIKRIHE